MMIKSTAKLITSAQPMPMSSCSCNLAANKLITFIMLEVSKRLLHIYDTLHLRQFTQLCHLLTVPRTQLKFHNN